MVKPVRTYLISYFAGGSFGRFFHDRYEDNAPNRGEIEEMEQQVKKDNGFSFCLVQSVSRIDPEAEARP